MTLVLKWGSHVGYHFAVACEHPQLAWPKADRELMTAMAGTTAYICISFPYVCQFAVLLHLTVTNWCRFWHCIAQSGAKNNCSMDHPVLFREMCSRLN